MPLSPRVEAWRARGRLVRALGLDIFTVDLNAAAGGIPVVLLHGFPTSSYDWRSVAEALARTRRVITFDFPGYGLSPKPPDFSYSLHEQADVVELVLRELGVREAHVIAHDMGTSVSCELAARRLSGLLHFQLRTLTLMNGSVHIELAHLTPSQKLLRRPTLGPLFARAARYTTFRAQMRKILGRPEAISDEELQDLFDLLKHGDGNLRLPRVISYIDERHRFRRRWIGALRALDVPLLVLWGDQDPVAVMPIAQRLQRETVGAELRRLDGLGHYPQLEDAPRVADELDRFLSQAGPPLPRDGSAVAG